MCIYIYIYIYIYIGAHHARRATLALRGPAPRRKSVYVVGIYCRNTRMY